MRRAEFSSFLKLIQDQKLNMTTRQKHIFTRNKPLVDIYSGRDHEGKEVEVREDAEQHVKYHEIVEALAAAGYHRAHMQALSPFDKIVGGMTWCIEVCDIDVDVNLLFEENLTIGKKIALTEKIVSILPSMQCPYTIEPHQIQGLDFINIYPLIVWLVKHSDEFREAKEDELRRFAVMQYDKKNIFECDRARFAQQRRMLINLATVQNLYKPCRVRKRKGPMPKLELEQVNAVLSEYDQRALLQTSVDSDESSKDEGLEFLRDFEKPLADPSKNTTLAERFDDQIEVGDSSERKLHYAILQSELSGDVAHILEEKEKEKYLEEVTKLKDQIEVVEREVDSMNEHHNKNIEERRNSLIGKKKELQTLKEMLIGAQDRALSNRDLKEMHSTLKALSREREELQKIIEHKTEEYAKLQQILEALKDPNKKSEEEPLSAEETRLLDDREHRMRAALGEMRLEVARASREALALAGALDERPAQAELLQYERRFMELLEQVAAKHKETKQFYTFHNTLYEVKLYTSKELSLLNSILENYDEAMSSTRKRDQFMSQLESIVEWVKTTVRKVEHKCQEERERRARLSAEYAQLLELGRQYAAALKRLAEERNKLKLLIGNR